MKFHFEINGDVQVSRELLRFAGWLGDASPAFHSIANMMRQQFDEQFRSEGAAGSGGWAPLAPSTVESKAMSGLSPEILQGTGRLMAALTRRGGDHIEIVEPDGLTIGAYSEYGGFHQSGTVNMPRRRPIELSGADRSEVMRTLQRFLVTGQAPL